MGTIYLNYFEESQTQGKSVLGKHINGYAHTDATTTTTPETDTAPSNAKIMRVYCSDVEHYIDVGGDGTTAANLIPCPIGTTDIEIPREFTGGTIAYRTIS